MRLAELRDRLERHLGGGYAGVWSSMQVIAELGGRTVDEALAAGVPPKRIWRAVWHYLELDERYR